MQGFTVGYPVMKKSETPPVPVVNKVITFQVGIRAKDEINVPIALSAFRDNWH